MELNHGAKIGGNDRQNGEDHPLGLDFGVFQTADDLKTFSGFGTFGFGVALHIFAEFGGKGIEVESFEAFDEGFGTHSNGEPIGDAVLFELDEFRFREKGVDLNTADKVG